MKQMTVSQIPETIKLMDGDTVVYEFTDLTDKWTESEGGLIYNNVVLPAKYTDWKKYNFTASAVNKTGDKLEATIEKTSVMRISIPKYGESRYIMFQPQFEQKVISQEPAKIKLRLADSESTDPLAEISVSSGDISTMKEIKTSIVKWAAILENIPEDWKAELFNIEAFNADGDKLDIQVSDGKMYKKPAVIVSFTNFKNNSGTPASIALMFN